MSKRALYSLIPLVMLAGCSLLPRDSGESRSSGAAPGGSTYKCFERDKCRVTVTVTACSAAGISANPYTLRVAPKAGTGVPIVWTLRAPAGYAWATDGINFKNKALANRQFTLSKGRADEFVLVDQNTVPGTFPYNIKVTRDGRDCPVHDPIVVNDDTNNP